MRRWPPKWECLKEASVGKKINKATGRMAEHYKCAECKEDFPSKEVQTDHRSPVVEPEVGFVDWDTFIQRLYCDKENLQILCTSCHKAKTLTERKKK